MTKHLRYQHFEVALRADGTPWVLGRGSMGVTYKGFDINLHCPVALKVVAPELLRDQVARERFQREARIAAAIRHPNVAAVSFLGEQDGEIFYAMEFVDGPTLDQEIRRHGRLGAPLALNIALQVCSALGAFHRHGLVHRDIKPANVLLEPGEEEIRAKLVDFGLAKFLAGQFTSPALALASAGGFHGTPYFASPEQINGLDIDIRSDIYSLGVTLFTMLTGQVPFSGSLAQVLSQHLSKPPPLEALPDLSPGNRALIARMLAKNPKGRFQTPAELRISLEAARREVVRTVPSPDSTSRDSTELRRGRGSFSGLTLLELMKRRRALPLSEAIVLLERIATKLDALQKQGLPFSAPTLGSIAIESLEDVDRRLDEIGSMSVVFQSEDSRAGLDTSDATVSPDLDLPPGSRTAPQVLAMLGYELLGGLRGASTSRWTPLSSLSAEGNASLRRAIEQPNAYESAAEVVDALKTELRVSRRTSAPRQVQRDVPVAPRSLQTSARGLPPVASKPHLGAIYAALGLGAIFVVLIASAGFWLLRPKPAAAPVPEPATPPSIEETTSSAQPVRPEDPAAPFRQAAEAAKLRDDDAEAFLNFSKALEISPENKTPREEMEKIAARLRSNAVQLTPERFSSLRGPLEEAAGHDVLSAQMLLGEWLRKSEPQTSLKWFTAAAAQGQTEAMTQAGLMMANGLGNEAPDFSAAVAWFQQGAAGGDTDSMVSLADCLLHGKGIAKNEVQALELLRAASALNHPAAMNMLGDLLKKGIPGLVDPDAGEALRLFARAREMGFLDAQANLGVMYVNGLGVPIDRNRAFNLWKDGAARGNPLNMYFYAMALEGGLTGPPRPLEARHWYLEAARQGNAAATDWCRRHGAQDEVLQPP